jgi:hypothetical protein
MVCGMKTFACLAAAAFILLGALSEARRVPDQP